MIEITRPGKYALLLQNPVMIATGMMGFDPQPFRNILAIERLGAVVTAGITYRPRKAARGARVVSMSGGVLMHTGLPNAGVKGVVSQYKKDWERSPVPIIAHVIANRYDDVQRSAEWLEAVPNVVGIELGFHDQAHPDDISDFIHAARQGCQLPVLVKLPLYQAIFLVDVAEMAGADALVIASPPRGREREPLSGQMVNGRLYGAFLKAQVLYSVEAISEVAQIPIIACGGIHSLDDARDYLKAGARAIQIDTLTWIAPQRVAAIAEALGEDT